MFNSLKIHENMFNERTVNEMILEAISRVDPKFAIRLKNTLEPTHDGIPFEGTLFEGVPLKDIPATREELVREVIKDRLRVEDDGNDLIYYLDNTKILKISTPEIELDSFEGESKTEAISTIRCVFLV